VELRKCIIHKITAMNFILWRYELFSLGLKNPRAITKSEEFANTTFFRDALYMQAMKGKLGKGELPELMETSLIFVLHRVACKASDHLDNFSILRGGIQIFCITEEPM
jgi:hypothetical protein